MSDRPRRRCRAHLEFYRELGIDGDQPRPRLDRPRRGSTDRPGAAPRRSPGRRPEGPPDALRTPSPEQRRNAQELPPAETPGGDPRATSATARAASWHRLGRKQIVYGVGNPSADLMFVGEAPGADEDIQGEPFVGRAGQLLTKIIEAMGFTRKDVYIANVLKCRPPGNRNPEPDEVASCQPFLFRQIDMVQPKVMVALGHVRGAGAAATPRIRSRGCAAAPGRAATACSCRRSTRRSCSAARTGSATRGTT